MNRPTWNTLSRPARIYYKCFIVLAIVVIIWQIATTMSHGLNHDEIVAYAPITKLLAQGTKIYTSYIDHQPPGVAILGIPFIWLLGNTVIAMKLAVCFYSLLFTFAVGWITYRINKSLISATLASLLVGFFACVYAQQRGVNVSSYAGIISVVGLACAVTVETGRRFNWLWSFVGGLIIGLGFMTKATIALEIPAMLLIVWLMRRIWFDALCMLIGILTGIGLICLYFASNGTLTEMLFVTFAMNVGYVGLNISNEAGSQSMLTIRLELFSSLFLPRTLPYLSGLIVASLVSLIWHIRYRRSTTLWAISFLCVSAFVSSVIAAALEIRYFFAVFAPFSILASLSFEQMLTSRLVRVGFILASILLFIPLLPPIGGLDTARQYEQSDYAQSIHFLDTHMNEQECLLTWGESLGGIVYFSDYMPCTRSTVEAPLMLAHVYDIRYFRAIYFRELLDRKPQMFAQAHIWGLFPDLQRLINRHKTAQLFHDDHLNIDFYALDWSNYRESGVVINNDTQLVGYVLTSVDGFEPGTEIEITPYWKVIDMPQNNYQGFVQLLSADYTTKLLSIDLPPTESNLPVSQWTYTDEILIGRSYKLAIPKDIQPGEYTLVMGLYGLSADHQYQPAEYFKDGIKQGLPFIELANISITH